MVLVVLSAVPESDLCCTADEVHVKIRSTSIFYKMSVRYFYLYLFLCRELLTLWVRLGDSHAPEFKSPKNSLSPGWYPSHHRRQHPHLVITLSRGACPKTYGVWSRLIQNLHHHEANNINLHHHGENDTHTHTGFPRRLRYMIIKYGRKRKRCVCVLLNTHHKGRSLCICMIPAASMLPLNHFVSPPAVHIITGEREGPAPGILLHLLLLPPPPSLPSGCPQYFLLDLWKLLLKK